MRRRDELRRRREEAPGGCQPPPIEIAVGIVEQIEGRPAGDLEQSSAGGRQGEAEKLLLARRGGAPQAAALPQHLEIVTMRSEQRSALPTLIVASRLDLRQDRLRAALARIDRRPVGQLDTAQFERLLPYATSLTLADVIRIKDAIIT